LQYVCADCWKQLDGNKEKYCIACKAQRDDKRDQRIEKAKGTAKTVGKTFTAAGTVMVAAARNVKQIENAGKIIIDVGGKVVKGIAKK
jgi:DNA-directed RNA polymerase subunit RPC12/RpoP